VNEERVSRDATAIFVLTAVAAVAIRPLRLPAAVVALAMFLGGAVLMAAALVIAARRSREVTIDIGALFFTQAPRALRFAFFVQIAVGFATAFITPTAAFGTLAPIAGLGLMGLWGARHGTFPARET
jgi:hypothetical protein